NVRQARMAAAGLVQAVEDARRAGGLTAGGRALLPRLALLDDGGTPKGLRHALDLLGGADLLIGPYGSGLAREAGEWAAERGRVIWNHGGSADEVEMQPRLVSIASPTSRYLTAVIEVVAGSLPGARVLVGAGTGSFGRAAARAARAGTAGAHVEYPAAQAYAAVTIALRCVAETGGFDDEALLAAARRLRCTTFFGRFGLGPDGRQADHALVVVQWQKGAKCIVGPPG